MSRVTAETLDLDKLLQNVAEIVKTVVPYDLFAILLYSEREQRLARVRYSIGHRDEVVQKPVDPDDGGHYGRGSNVAHATGPGGRRVSGSTLSERAGCGAQASWRCR